MVRDQGRRLVTLILLTAAMVLGILNAGRFASRRWPRFLVQGLHRNLSLLALLFLALHVGTTVMDTYTTIGLPDAIVPFLSPYKRWWLGLGALASDLMLTLAVTSLLRQRIGHRLWRVRALGWLPVLAGRDHARTRHGYRS